MRLGFIGTGGIAEAIVKGIHHVPSFSFPLDEILLSQRNVERSARLASRFEKVRIVGVNQEIVEQADWVFLAVLPNDTESVISELTFPPNKQLISLIAGVSVERLRKLTGVENVVRIIPLPPVELGAGPIPIFPPSDRVEPFLNQIGTAVPISNEMDFSTFSAASAIMATYFEFSATVAGWIKKQGLPDDKAATYATSMLHALAMTTVDLDYESLARMSESCLTTGGLNEQILYNKRDTRWFDSIESQLDKIMKRIQ